MSSTAPSTDVAAIVASVQRSPCAVDYPWLPGLVERAIQSWASRAEAAPKRSAARSARIEAAVTIAAQRVSRLHPLRTATGIVRQKLEQSPAAYGLPGDAVPCDRVIRRVVLKVFGPSEPNVPSSADGAAIVVRKEVSIGQETEQGG